MAKDGLLIGEVSRRSGASRKALRLYETDGILPAPRRTAAGYRVYAADTLAVLSFVRRARGLGFTLGEIKQIIAIRRAGRTACPHVRELVRRKSQEVDQRLKDLTALRDGLRALLDGWRSSSKCDSAICPQIEARSQPRKETRKWRE